MLTGNASRAIIGKSGHGGLAGNTERRANHGGEWLLRGICLRQWLDERHKQQQHGQPQTGNPVAAKRFQQTDAAFQTHALSIAAIAAIGKAAF